MGERLTFIYELSDKVSAPAARIAKALGDTERVTRAAGESSDSLLSKFVKFGGRSPMFIDPLNAGVSIISAFADAAIGAASALANLSFTAGKFAVETLAFKE